MTKKFYFSKRNGEEKSNSQCFLINGFKLGIHGIYKWKH